MFHGTNCINADNSRVICQEDFILLNTASEHPYIYNFEVFGAQREDAFKCVHAVVLAGIRMLELVVGSTAAMNDRDLISMLFTSASFCLGSPAY